MSLKLGTQNIAGIPTGLIATVNGKADANNVYTKTEIDTKPQIIAPYLKTTYVNGTSGYRIWSDGYCEQWGFDTATGKPHTITLLKTYKDTNYNIQCTIKSNDSNNPTYRSIGVYTTITTNSFNTYSDVNRYWKVSGYLAQGEY